MNRVLLIMFLGILPFQSIAQDEALEEVIVTGFRGSDYYEMPSVTIKKTADFLVQEIRLINDSRAPDLRKKEIIQSIDNLIKASKKFAGIQLSYGQGFLVPVNLNDDSLQIIKDRKRVDTSFVDIYVKVKYNKQRDAKSQIADLRKFISKANLVGRTEIETLGDIGLTIVGPEQYRYEIMKKIASESEKIKGIVGKDCEISIEGFQGRVEWDRSEIDELTLYIPYGMKVTCK